MDWLIAISPTAAFAGILWLSRNLIATRLTNAVRHEYDGKIEKIKSDLRVTESQIESLRNGALSNLAQRQTVIFERKVKAVEQLWKSIDGLAYVKTASHLMRNIDFEKAVKLSSQEANVKEFFNLLPFDLSPEKIPKDNAHECRPFVSPMSWAYYSAYRAIVFDAVVRLMFLRNGLKEPNLINTNHSIKLVEVALPHHAEGIKVHGISYTYLLLEELENKILEEFSRVLEGTEDDQDMISKAEAIIKAADALVANGNKTQKSS